MTFATGRHPIVAVVAAVITDGDAVLVCRRAPHRPGAGVWEFPGGKVEPGEDREAALTREIREELGVAIVITGELTTDDTPVGDRVIRLSCFTARLADHRPLTSTDHDLLAWVSVGELSARDWSAPDLPAVRALVTRGRGAGA